MFDLYELLFEVSNELRHRILYHLQRAPSTVTWVSQQESISMTEASRHFNRLSQAGLIRKRPEGDYVITLIGRTILSQVEPLSFVVNHSQYFHEHDATKIPESFLNRIHELSDAEANYAQPASIMRLVENIERIPIEAEEYSYCILDDSSMELVLYSEPEPNDEKTQLIIDTISGGIISRALFPSSLDRSRIPKESMEAFVDLHRLGNFEFRIINTVDLFLYMNEKYSIVSFPNRVDKFNYLGFEARDRRSLNWCKEVFDHYWARSKPFLTH